MPAAERLSEKWAFGREAKLRGQMWARKPEARKGFIYFISLPLIFNSQNFKTARKHGKKASGDLMANARDWRVGVNLIGLTNFISTVIGPNLTSCHLKLILVTPLGSKNSKTWRFWFIYSDVLFKNLTRKKRVLVSEFTSVKHRMCKIWSTWRWTDFSSFSRLRWSTSAGLSLFWAEGHRVSSRVGFSDGSRASFAGLNTCPE